MAPDAEFFEGRDAYFADPEGNYWEVAWAAEDNPVTAAARRAAGIATDVQSRVNRPLSHRVACRIDRVRVRVSVYAGRAARPRSDESL